MVSLFAQDMESATALYNEGATALNAGDKETALGYFEEALSQAELIGPEAEELAYNCKRNIPTLINAMGKELAAANELDAAIETLNKAVEKANEYGQAEPVLTNAIHLEGMPLANVHAYSFEAGSHTLLLPTGMALVLGFTDSSVTARNAALDGSDDAMDWLFY